MQWQMWTAFGIMFGYVADLAFYFVSVDAGDDCSSFDELVPLMM